MRYQAAQELPPSKRLFDFQDDYDLADYIGDARRSLVRADVSRTAPRIVALKAYGTNWDRRGSAAANQKAVDRAVGVLDTHALQVREANLDWQDPHVTLNEEGDVVFEWWRGIKKLTLYIGESSIEFVSSWGADMDRHMHAGVLDGNLLKLWQWLVVPAER